MCQCRQAGRLAHIRLLIASVLQNPPDIWQELLGHRTIDAAVVS